MDSGALFFQGKAEHLGQGRITAEEKHADVDPYLTVYHKVLLHVSCPASVRQRYPAHGRTGSTRRPLRLRWRAAQVEGGREPNGALKEGPVTSVHFRACSCVNSSRRRWFLGGLGFGAGPLSASAGQRLGAMS